jgi:choline dehydrogenase
MPWSSGPACNTRATMISFKGRRNRIDDPHPVGTCKIGDDESAVLDSRLRVRALCRVFDPSIMLTITSAYTNAPTISCREQHQRLTRSAPPINGIDAFFKAYD